MKTLRFTNILVLFLSVIAITVSANAQECVNITLTSQTDVDAFSCNIITGNLEIEGADITDLSSLLTLTSVGGYVFIANNPLLTNLDGLSSLTSVDGMLFIASNPVLSEFCGLYTLISGGGPGFYMVFANATYNPTQQEIIDGGPCSGCDIQINSIAVTDEGCPGGNDGYISVDASCNSCSGIEYSIDGSTYQSSNEFTNLSHGSYSIYVKDIGDNSCSESSSVNVNPGIDNEDPELNVVSAPLIMWPPNHKYESISMDQLFVGVSDNCAILFIDDVYIESVSSDEPDNGENDGNTTNDILIDSDCLSIQLRRERDEYGNGRVYKINLAVDDGNGNTGIASVQVHVPIGSKEYSIDNGENHAEYCGKSSFITDNKPDETLLENFPNPFSQKTTIAFSVPQFGKTTVNIYNSSGYLVANLYEGYAEEGQQYEIYFDGSSLSKGVYFCQLHTEHGTQLVWKMVLIK